MTAHLRFKKVYVEVTSLCNLACSFCPPTLRPAAFLSPDQFHRIAEQIAPRTGHVHFHVKGEPLLHPRLGELLDIAADTGLKVHIVTNGVLIERTAETLLGHPALYQINFSLHSFEAESRTVSGYLDPIIRFARRAAAQGTYVALRFWREPCPEILEAVEQEFGWTAPPPGTREGHGFPVARSVFVHFEREFVWPSLDAPVRSLVGFCLGLRDQVAILADGTVVPCCLDGEGVMALGNVFTEELPSLLMSPRALVLYQGFTEQRCVEPLCQRCGFRAKERNGRR